MDYVGKRITGGAGSTDAAKLPVFDGAVVDQIPEDHRFDREALAMRQGLILGTGEISKRPFRSRELVVELLGKAGAEIRNVDVELLGKPFGEVERQRTQAAEELLQVPLRKPAFGRELGLCAAVSFLPQPVKCAALGFLRLDWYSFTRPGSFALCHVGKFNPCY